MNAIAVDADTLCRCGNPLGYHDSEGCPPAFDMPEACFICGKSDPADPPVLQVLVEGENEGICSACWDALP